LNQKSHRPGCRLPLSCEVDLMNQRESFSNSLYIDQIRLAERELSAFIFAVAELFGPEQARLSTEDWLDELELMDSPPGSTSRAWRTVTIAASARLASRLNVCTPSSDALRSETDKHACRYRTITGI
jgi:hypothetical protein